NARATTSAADDDPVVAAMQVDADFGCLFAIEPAPEVRPILSLRRCDRDLRVALIGPLHSDDLGGIGGLEVHLTRQMPVVATRCLGQRVAPRFERAREPRR